MTGHLADGFEVHVTAELPRIIAVHSHIQHDRSGLHHVGRDEMTPTNRSHDYVSLQRMQLQVGCTAVANGDGGIFLQQHHRHGLANNVGASNHDGMLAL